TASELTHVSAIRWQKCFWDWQLVPGLRTKIKFDEMIVYSRRVPALVTSQLLMTPQKRQKEDPKPVFLTFLQHHGAV
ncbi:hypothetical protein LEMLEM_LOCUS13770, partial [Lemmus lemmus]